jgi:hypothetical protein
MKLPQFRFVLFLLHVWMTMALFGAIIFETIIVYPNIFNDVPRSLDTAMTFLSVAGPSDFFPPLGTMTLLVGLVTLILSWSLSQVRYWLMGSILLIFVGEFLFSLLVFWPRNTIMFEEGLTVHSVDYIRQVAQEFQNWHWLRFAMNVSATLLSFVAFLKFYRQRVATQKHLEPDTQSAGKQVLQ